jgi:hypothetical protein
MTDVGASQSAGDDTELGVFATFDEWASEADETAFAALAADTSDAIPDVL